MSADPPPEDRIARAAREAFGYARLRPGQHDAIAALVEGDDCFAVLPTGAGKSAIYQVAALLRDAGPTLVVSPLIALQATSSHTCAGTASRRRR